MTKQCLVTEGGRSQKQKQVKKESNKPRLQTVLQENPHFSLGLFDIIGQHHDLRLWGHESLG
ncbi:hypothetical protein PILCRDRAFT_823954 [Piloderma croceum F 1598]|uniref:Uncharacterized protein n=1 Tax=Piloderma croceum (strain F 1598) TaxID=765440 RepID=A0A0C3FG87_PILCF|nr:hypothetical protein PILCRDRAFT_823954 [Piloderma croceum F 1598]